MTEQNAKDDAPDNWENVLEKIRKGYKERLHVQVGEFQIPCRVLSAREQYNVLGKVVQQIELNPGDTKDQKSREMRQSVEYWKATLKAATTFGQESEVTQRFWDELPASVLSNAFDRYDALLKEIDPEFEKLDLEKITEMMDMVKKKKATWRDFFITDLAVMGRYFLETLSLMDKERG